MNIGVPFTSREWMSARRPYSWSQFTDCSTVVESVASYYAIKLAGQPAALAGGDLKGQARRAQEYQTLKRDLESHLHTWYGYRWRQALLALDPIDSEAPERVMTAIAARRT